MTRCESYRRQKGLSQEPARSNGRFQPIEDQQDRARRLGQRILRLIARVLGVPIEELVRDEPGLRREQEQCGKCELKRDTKFSGSEVKEEDGVDAYFFRTVLLARHRY